MAEVLANAPSTLGWVSSVVATIAGEEQAAFYVDSGADSPKHLWVVTQRGLVHAEMSRDGTGYYTPQAELHPWVSMTNTRIWFTGFANNGTDWIMNFSCESAGLSLSASSIEARATAVLAAFAAACLDGIASR